MLQKMVRLNFLDYQLHLLLYTLAFSVEICLTKSACSDWAVACGGPWILWILS